MERGQPTLFRGASSPPEPCSDDIDWLIEHPDRCNFDELDADDLRLLVYAAKAFNLGMTTRADREPQVVERLDIAVQRVGAAVGIKVRRGPITLTSGDES
jgi:hypothetical protein